MLDLAALRKRLPWQLAQMSDEQLEVCLREMYAVANLAIDVVKADGAARKIGASPDEDEQ